MLIMLLNLFDNRSWLFELYLLVLIIQYAIGFIFVISYLAAEEMLQCVRENEDAVIVNVSSLPISKTLKEQLSEQIHCIARYYGKKTKR